MCSYLEKASFLHNVFVYYAILPRSCLFCIHDVDARLEV
uniref:Uncharacterized protein n=1 Tax=Rhizophora mucronata TaxID=61149 RepID=A0A2P2NMI2_RHIMU